MTSYQGFSDYSSKINLVRAMTTTPISNENSCKLILILVGLPARGKSYLSRKICSFLTWRGHTCKVFNAGELRRNLSDIKQQKADFFNAEQTDNLKKRNDIAMRLLDSVFEWFRTKDNQIAIFDATNTTKSRRKMLIEKIIKENFRYLFIESICSDKKVLEENYLAKAKNSPDFKGIKLDAALIELKKRVENYEKVYETIEDSENFGYIKLIDLGKKLVSFKLQGYISRLLMIFLINLNLDKKIIWLTRAGNCTEDNLSGSKGRKSSLSDEGLIFAKRLNEFVQKHGLKHLQVWSSPLKRALDTAQFLQIDQIKTEEEFQSSPESAFSKVTILPRGMLNNVNLGICYGMKPSHIKRQHPQQYSAWRKCPLGYRFPGGESYADGVERIEPVVIDLEHSSESVLIITHISILRIIYAYFRSIPVEKAVDVCFPQGLVIEFKPSLYGWQEKRYDLMEHNRKTDVEDELTISLKDIDDFVKAEMI